MSQGGYSILHFHQQSRVMHIQFLSVLTKHMVLSPLGPLWPSAVVLICISLMTHNIEHLFMGLSSLFAHHLQCHCSSLVPISSLDYLVNCFLRLFLTSCGSSLDVLNADTLLAVWFANIFSQSLACLFIFLSAKSQTSFFFLIFF